MQCCLVFFVALYHSSIPFRCLFAIIRLASSLIGNGRLGQWGQHSGVAHRNSFLPGIVGSIGQWMRTNVTVPSIPSIEYQLDPASYLVIHSF